MSIKDSLLPFFDEGKRLLEENKITEVEFSKGTYQIKVDETPPAWTFFKFQNGQALQDWFCSCDEQDEKGGCRHLAAAYLFIFSGKVDPLHVRFKSSFWALIFAALANRFGLERLSKKIREGVFQPFPGLKIQGLEESALVEIFNDSQQLSETTSIKFSGFSEEEIKLYKEGRPSFELSYELSPIADLAKLFFFRSEVAKERSFFFHPSDTLPMKLFATIDQIHIEVDLDNTLLLSILEAKDLFSSNLSIDFQSRKKLLGIFYEPKKRRFSLSFEKNKKENPKNGVQLGPFTFFPNQGFIKCVDDPLFEHSFIGEDMISSALNNRLPLFESLCRECTFYKERKILKFHPSFCTNHALKISAYLKTPGDLDGRSAALFQDWICLDENTFYPVDSAPFFTLSQTVEKEHVTRFVRRYRHFFDSTLGFQTYLADVETKLSYRVDERGALHFFRKIDDKREQGIDFGGLYYLEEHGFYVKSIIPSSSDLRPGAKIQPSDISSFISQNREELALIPDFFSESSPLISAKLDINRTEKGKILVKPIYEIKENVSLKDLIFYDEYLFWPGHGFSKIPQEALLPDGYGVKKEIDQEEIDSFYAYDLPFLRSFIHKIDPTLEQKEAGNLKVESLKEREGGELSFSSFFETELGRVWLIDVLLAKSKGHRFVLSEAGVLDVNDPSLDALRFLEGKPQEEKAIQISPQDFLIFDAVSNLSLADPNSDSKALFKSLHEMKPLSKPDLTSFQSTLRPYQMLGFEWLYFLASKNLGALLCDDMGLGKTHQAMALILALFNQGKRKTLVVCPTSVLYHWQEKLKEHLPTLKVLLFHGLKREIEEDFDLMITSYGIVRREIDLLKSWNFSLLIFDEVQCAKNPLSRTHKALLKLKRECAVGLTGTPIENHLGELKSLFDLVLPGLFPSQKVYEDYFVKPIEKEGDPRKKELLSSFISPFILRRRKKSVLKELPDKVEEVLYADLTPIQKNLYTEALLMGRRQIEEKLEGESRMPFMHIFSLLTKLKQICDHPAVVLNDPKGYQKYPSGKFMVFCEYLAESLESGHKVVVFSHYLTMLKIFENYLGDQGIGFAKIEGSTKNRSEEIRRFNKDPSCKVFIASLQAAGLGIDLTAASVVIHYDRWWNAAREIQATDRVHRIGQKKGVLVFKLVTKHTFEERIDQIITLKGALMEDVIRSDDHTLLKAFNKEQILSLLSDLPKESD